MNLGVIDDDTLKQQWEKYCKSDDKNPEHYRFGAFVEFLAKKEHFTDTDIQKILGLDEDTALGGDLRDSRLIAFVESGALTDNQFQALAPERAIRKSPCSKNTNESVYFGIFEPKESMRSPDQESGRRMTSSCMKHFWRQRMQPLRTSNG